MKFVDIANNSVTVELSPEDCQRLAVMCDDFAHGNDNREAFIQMAGLYTAAFEAASLSSAAHYFSSDENMKLLTLANLRDEKLINPQWGEQPKPAVTDSRVPREYAYAEWGDRDWAAHERFQERNLQSSMVQFGFEHAEELGWCSDVLPSDGEMIPAPGGADVVRALTTERPVAEVYAQICRDLQIEMPAQVIAAIQTTSQSDEAAD